ncbi:MAG: hypothetical protein ACD_4C00113G0002 [uncultured bacterium (gcode 4)]|uniref:Uncharacterized protein n=1 Tax=uncultured bacterium (gcode 4) TaxID=1234023 RepID=K2F725_9BACT|nr:MAG: hypothetical protein ACD_4C00113G0002 [uncultured bacterium (gcode 4)]
MNIWKIEKNEFIKFTIYTILFLILFIWYNTVSSPISEKSFNSASINNNTTKRITYSQDVFELWKKEQDMPSLIINFQPKYIKIDENLLKILKLNTDSKIFKNKVTPLNLIIDWSRTEPRWQVTWNKLILSNKIKLPAETVKVFVHELWHIIDLYYLNSNYWYDLSDEFYKISWISYNIKNKNAKIEDFVSWYWLTNKYEDFAESFGFYIFHNETFKRLSEKNKKLKLKYDFFKKYVFIENEFLNTSFWNETIKSYNWDTTKISINLKKYLYYVR